MSERGHTGRLVGGRFELLDRLGSGGMGTVWRARDLGLDREVAIKEVRPADAALYEHNPALAAQQRERVLRESRALARLQHPNVVSIYQILEVEGSPYPWIVMELVRGSSLQDRLRHGALTPQEAARIGRGVLGALRAAHAAGIHHRDVKPANVLLRPEGGAVLTDFGIAALRDSTTLTATGEVIGSPEYIAPERLHGDETRTASDLWSLAMLLYVAVEGYHPLRRASTMATLAAVMTEPVPPPRRAGPLTPALTATLVADPAARPNGEQLDLMLAAAEAGAVAQPAPYQPPAGPAPYQPGPDTGAAGRKRAVAWAGVATLATSAVVATVIALIMSRVPGEGGAAGNGSPGTRTAGVPQVSVSTAPTAAPTAPATDGTAQEDLLTPRGARAAVAALTKEMGGSKVSELDIYADHASATAPTKAVKNGFDSFTYRGGTVTRDGPDGVDEDRAVLDLKAVNWDALPALWKRAEKELGVDKPTARYLAVETDIIDGTASMSFYLADDYGGAYLKANLNGEVIELYAR
ncbi:protein kinase domain-containing protein [Actinophytocola sp.]|uniref:serine/threonine-protein kinase n=1 Tax=Actinophytocola sp. TaxID=1872138 RepID=UPI003D6C6C4A